MLRGLMRAWRMRIRISRVEFGFHGYRALQPTWLSAGDAMGMSVAIDGTTALVGIPAGQGIGVDTGRVDRWVQSGGTYTHTNLFYGSDLGLSDTAMLGWSVSASGHLNVGGASRCR